LRAKTIFVVMANRIILILFFFCSFIHVFPQQAKEGNIEQRQFNLKHNVEGNEQMLRTNPDEAFARVNDLLNEARALHNTNLELQLLRQKTSYYYYAKVDFNKLIESAKELKEKSKSYNNPYYHADANLYLFDAYCLNKLYNEALNELDEGSQKLNQIQVETDDLLNSRANFYLAYANYYSQLGDSKSEIKNLLSAVNEHSKAKDPKKKQEFSYKDFTNLADAYARVNKMDSARYFAERSIVMGNDLGMNDASMYSNYLTLGQVYQNYKEPGKALYYYKKAENTSARNHFLNVEKLYEKLIEVYGDLGDEKNKKDYEYKLKDLKLKVSENKNESLHKILEETRENDKSRIYIYILLGSFVVIVGLLIMIIRFRRKNKLLEQQEKASQEYLQEQPEPNEQSYKDLIEMVKHNDPAFLGDFLKTFPGFFEKLQSFNPNIVQSEVEFCALLKLNLPTKDIARFRNLEPKTIQNKKYRIRKKLNIPENMDIYYWFSQL